MHVPGRPAFGRSPSLGIVLAVLALLLVGSGTALAAGGSTTTADEPATPRAQEPGDPTGYRLPFEPGLEVPVHQGWLTQYSHSGRAGYAYDFGLHEGTPVLAAAPGVVAFAVDGATACGGPDLLTVTNYVTINHLDGSATHYGHLEGVDVEVGDAVEAGQQIGRAGKTGYTGCMPHLHFARQEQGGPVTQSIPVYFDGFADRAFASGDLVAATAPACSPSDEKAPRDAFCGTYAARGEGGPTFFSRIDKTIDFHWSKRAPGGYWLDDPVDGFSARWAGRFEFAAAGFYEIRVRASGPVRVAIDGVTVVEDGSAKADPRDVDTAWFVAPGVHLVEVEHESPDGTGAMQLDWSFLHLHEDAARWSRSGPQP